MTKEELLKTVNALPEEFIVNAYVLDLANGKIQMNYNSDLVRRFGKEGKITDSGYFKFTLNLEDDYRFSICMT
jgi:hypothetical protein